VLHFETSRQRLLPVVWDDWSTMTSQTSATKLLSFVAYQLLLTGLTRSLAVLRLRVAVH